MRNYCIRVYDSLIGTHPMRYFTHYGDLRNFIDKLENLNMKYHGDIIYYWLAYRRDYENKKWDYIGGFNHYV